MTGAPYDNSHFWKWPAELPNDSPAEAVDSQQPLRHQLEAEARYEKWVDARKDGTILEQEPSPKLRQGISGNLMEMQARRQKVEARQQERKGRGRINKRWRET